MIIDSVKNMGDYPLLKPVAKFLSENGELENGAYDVSDGIKLKVMDYDTDMEDSEFESHEKFYDVQMVLEGEEFFQMAFLASGTITQEYNEVKDIALYRAKPQVTVLLKKGNFVLIKPNELHRGSITVETTAHVKKYVFKIKY